MKVLIEFEKRPLLFEDPVEIIAAKSLTEIPACFDRMETALKQGYYLAGFFSYESGFAFEEKLKTEEKFDFPLLCFGVYRQMGSSDSKTALPAGRQVGSCFRPGTEAFSLGTPAINLPVSRYFSNIQKIKDHIASGDVYQITYCLKYMFDFHGDEHALYRRLLQEQSVPYPAFIQTDDFSILSLSPEMFMKKSGDRIVTKPMKGTWFRNNPLEFWNGWRLHFDPKNRAENIMICDLLRNDLGRIGNQVKAPKLFEVARYRTLYQMTSTVTGRIDQDIPLYMLFAALYPSGSVTGAPKIRAMELINELETDKRKIYTGAIGYITPAKDLFFNVPIRTLLLQNGRGEMGVGGGIVWDSTPEGELEECRIKARFLTGSTV